MPITVRSGWRAISSAARAGVLLIAVLPHSVVVRGQDAASDSASIGRMIRDASRAIQSGNAASFLGFFDSDEFSEFPTLRAHVVALTSQRQIASSVEILKVEKQEYGHRLWISWILQLTYTGDPGPVESRQETVACTVRQRGKSWKIVHFDPVTLFRP